MSSLTVDGNFPSHPKVAPLTDAAFRLHLHAMAYCAQHETDGFLDERLLQGLSNHKGKDKLVLELVGAKARPDGEPLWKRVPGGWTIHDFLIWNESHADLEAKRKAAIASESSVSEARRKAGRQGAYSRWQTDTFANGKPDGKPDGKPAAEPIANGDNGQGTLPLANDGKCHLAGAGALPPDLSGSDLEELADPDPTSTHARTKKRRPEVAIPEGFTPDETSLSVGAELGFDSVRIASELVKMRLNAEKQDKRWRNWQAAFQGWLRRAKEFETKDRANGRGLPDVRRPIVQRDDPSKPSGWTMPEVK